MKFEPTTLKDAWVITMEPHGDERGHFARAFCRKEFEAHGIETDVMQCNTSLNKRSGTLRGMHFQREPISETKLVRCIRGAMHDVIIDLRPESPTYLQHFAMELTQDNLKMLFVPRGFAHGFLTLEDNTEAFYMVGEFYTPECESGLRHDDPVLGIEWPAPVRVISDKDRNWPLLRDNHL